MNALRLFFLIFISLLVLFQPASAGVVDFSTKYQDYNGIWRQYTEYNINTYPFYTVEETETQYIISRQGDNVILPKRLWISYYFGNIKIIPLITIQNYSQIDQLVTKISPTVWYISVPWSASRVINVTDDLIDMGIFSRTIKIDITDSDNIVYEATIKVVGDEIRIYFNPQQYVGANWPIRMIENTIFVNNATTSGWSSSNISFNNVTLNRDTNNILLRQYVDDYNGYWRFDGSFGAIAYNENRTNNRHGTMENMASGLNNCTVLCSGWITSGKYGNAISFDNLDDTVNFGDGGAMDVNSSFTVSGWVYPISAMGSAGILTKKYANPFGIFFSNNHTYVAVKSGGTTYYARLYSWLNASTINKWHYLTGTWDKNIDSGKIKLYINGTEVTYSAQDTITNDVETSAYDLYAGYYQDGQVMNGTLDEMRLYNRSLTQSEIRLIMNNTMVNSGNLTITQQNTTSWAHVINRTRVIIYNVDSNNTVNILTKPNTSSTWETLITGATNNTWYDIPTTIQTSSQDFRIILNGNSTSSPETYQLEWDEDLKYPNIRGYVNNNLMVPISGARIDYGANYTLTNSSGYYSLYVLSGNVDFLIRGIGYNNLSTSAYITSNTSMNFSLNERIPATEQNIIDYSISGVIGGIMGAMIVIGYIKRRR